LVVTSLAFGQSSFDGEDLAYRSSGFDTGNDWVLTENGYVGTYFTLDAPGAVTLSVDAAGSTTDAVMPRMNFVIADLQAGFDVAGGFASYEHTFDLPAGTYFVRTEFNNDAPTASRQLTIRSLEIDGASSVNNSTSDVAALAAADTYIEHFRQGPARVGLVGLAPGTQAEVKMVRNEFNVGTMVQGFDANVFLGPVSPGDTTSTAARYQQFVNDHFNILVPSNMGKWQPNENNENMPTLGHVDTILDYAESHHMNVRMHNLLWGNQQPGWVNDLIDDAQSSNPSVAAQAKAELLTAINNRIAYYVGDGDTDTSDGDRSKRYLEIDVLNEALREGTYWDVFGAEGIAEIYKNVKNAVEAAGANTRLYTNEYNIFQFANNPDTGQSDDYANWYRRNVEEINNAGYGQVVTGIGIQAIEHPPVHSASSIYRVLHNMAVTGLPITVTEFSVHPEFGGIVTTEEVAAQLYNENLRLLFGHPNGVSFLIWEPWPPATTDPTTIMDQNWNLRAAGQELVNLLDSWTTPTQDLIVGPDGTIDFSGFYGDYEITIDGQTFDLSLVKGTQTYSLVVAPGDYNGNGTVDAADYTIWRDTLGSAADLRADGNGNLVIDEGDYGVWKSAFGTEYNLGASAFGAAGAAVPEPATVLLLLMGCILLGWWRN
jgi:GH35 family endo-1,4-beta-xylanase